MITSGTLGAIIASAPLGARREAINLLEILLSCAAIGNVPIGLSRVDVRTAQVAIDHLESRATRRMGGKMPLRAWRAGLTLRAIIARARPVIHEARGPFLCDDETDGKPQWWNVGARVAANTNEAREKRQC